MHHVRLVLSASLTCVLVGKGINYIPLQNVTTESTETKSLVWKELSKSQRFHFDVSNRKNIFSHQTLPCGKMLTLSNKQDFMFPASSALLCAGVCMAPSVGLGQIYIYPWSVKSCLVDKLTTNSFKRLSILVILYIYLKKLTLQFSYPPSTA